MRTEAEVRRYKRFVELLIVGPDVPGKPTEALVGEYRVLEWMLGEGDDPPDLDKIEFMEQMLGIPAAGTLETQT